MSDIKIKPTGLSEELKEQDILVEEYEGKNYYYIKDMFSNVYFGKNNCCDFGFFTEYSEERDSMYVFGGISFLGFNGNRDDQIIVCESEYLYDNSNIDDLKAKYKQIVQECNKAYENWVREFIANFTDPQD